MAEVTAARIIIPVTTNASKATTDMRALNKTLVTSGKQLDKTGRKAKSAGNFFRKLAVGALIAKGMQLATKAASDLEEQTGKFAVTFRGVTKIAEQASKSLQAGFGFSELAAKEFLSTTGDLVSGLGFTQEASISLSSKLNSLAADVTSFKNVSGGTEQTIRAFNSAILGEREALKSLGFSISEAEVKEVLLAKGQEKLTGGALRQAKALATVELIMKKNSRAVGDFARTSQNLANQQRLLGAAFTDLSASAGKELTGPFTELAKALTDSAGKGGILRTVLGGLAKVAGGVVTIVANLVKFLNSITNAAQKIDRGTGFTRLTNEVKSANDRIAAYRITLRAADTTAGLMITTQKLLAADLILVAKLTKDTTAAQEDSNNKKRLAGIAVDDFTEKNENLLKGMKAINAEITQTPTIAAKLVTVSEKFTQIATAVGNLNNVFALLAQASRNSTQQQINDLQARQDAQLATAAAAGATDDELTAMRIVNEEKLAKKQRDLNRQAVKDQKKFGRISIIIDTAIAVAKIWSQTGILGAVSQGLAIAAGAAQLAVLESTPVPAQFGGSFVVPPGNEADSGLLAVNSGEQVDVTPVRDSGGGGQGGAMTLNVDGQQMDAWMIDSMNRNLNNGKVQIRRSGTVKVAG